MRHPEDAPPASRRGLCRRPAGKLGPDIGQRNHVLGDRLVKGTQFGRNKFWFSGQLSGIALDKLKVECPWWMQSADWYAHLVRIALLGI